MQVRTEIVEAEAAAAMVQLEELQAIQQGLEARNELLETFTLAKQQVLPRIDITAGCGHADRPR